MIDDIAEDQTLMRYSEILHGAVHKIVTFQFVWSNATPDQSLQNSHCHTALGKLRYMPIYPDRMRAPLLRRGTS